MIGLVITSCVPLLIRLSAFFMASCLVQLSLSWINCIVSIFLPFNLQLPLKQNSVFVSAQTCILGFLSSWKEQHTILLRLGFLPYCSNTVKMLSWDLISEMSIKLFSKNFHLQTCNQNEYIYLIKVSIKIYFFALLSKYACQCLIFKLNLLYNFTLMLNKTEFADRLKDLRKRKRISQGELAELIEVHFTQVSRYERGETKPNAEAMTKLAKALDTTVDFLMNGTADDVVKDAGLEKELISRFKEVQDLGTEEKKTVLSLMDAYIAKTKIQTLLTK